MGKKSDTLGRVVFRIALLAFVPCLVALAVNAARPTSLDWIASTPYEIFGDCPEATSKATVISFGDLYADLGKVLLVDARSGEEGSLKVPGAFSLPYDSLFPVSEEDISRLRTKADGRTLVVFGEGQTGKLLADDLASQGMTKLRYLEEGEDWRKLLKVLEGGQ